MGSILEALRRLENKSELRNDRGADLAASGELQSPLVALEAADQAISAELQPPLLQVEPEPAPALADQSGSARLDQVAPYLPVPTDRTRALAEAWRELVPRTSRGDLDELCAAIRAQLAPGVPPSLLLTSADSTIGATSVVVRLAESMADNGQRVLAIDANLRRRDLSRSFDAEGAPGLSDMLATGLMQEDLIARTPRECLRVLPAGLARELVWDRAAEANFAVLLGELKRQYDLIVVDAAEARSPDVCGLSRCCDVTYLVARLGKTCRWDAMAAIRYLQSLGGRATGAILTR